MKRIALLLLIALATGCGRTELPMAGAKWAELVRGPDAKLRRKAAFTLGNIGASDPAVVPALLAALKDSDAGVRGEAVLALLKCGAAGRAAVNCLREMCQRDPDAQVRAYAAKAIDRLESM
jgi:HEAT repeat protein